MGIGFEIGGNSWYNRKGSGASASEFIIEVKTDNAGTSNDNQFTLPANAGTYDVDWGDGNSDLSQTGALTHTYSSAGTYEIKVTGMTHIYFFNGGDKLKLIDIKNWGDTAWTSMRFAFSGCALTSISASDTPDLSSVFDMEGIFNNCNTFNSNINDWDISNVTNLKFAFSRTNNFNQPLDNWDTSNVTNMQGMFQITGFDQDISAWDINQVTNLSNFMTDCILSTSNYDALLIAWDAQGTMSYSGTVNFGTSKYTSGGAAETARTSLISKWGAIVDGGAA